MKQTSLKRTLFLTLLFILSFLASQAQWTPVRSIYNGTLANDGAVSFSIGNKGYVVAGSSTNITYEYDTALNKWTNYGTVPASMGRAFAMSFVLNGYAYIIGGDTGGHPVPTVWRFNPLAGKNAWFQLKDFPGGMRDAGFGFAVNNAGYVGGGFDGSAIYDDIWKYNEPNDSWTKLSGSVPQALIFPASFVSGNKAYLLTGGVAPSGVNETDQMWRFDPVTQQWDAKAAFGGGGRQACFAFASNGLAYVGGGQTSYTTVYQDMWQYNIATDKWTKVGNAPLLGPAWSSAFVIGNNAYVGLGAAFTSTGLTGTDSFYRYRIAQTTGVGHIAHKEPLWSVYPNPVHNSLLLQGTLPTSFSVSIYDITGRLVMTATDINERKMDVQALPAGCYTIRISVAGTEDYQRFIKQ
jgi:N-acetylneuraminic acid mutarotase